ncbi:dihydrolipoyl dehydrogenase [Formosimonas limnophila]|uniref:Dihydrolipoyl dehydrogenase n=1 Tax=Formosimonas limnophila TaxID=1384487 RepID=A0A8J3G044_9BURK|nr:dihydrolipoyl dehydrogenase [Formosimonas limnophila]GHA65215.1 dihydrolipoyl dehydrogenase [Formosimonas limnophila]
MSQNFDVVVIGAGPGGYIAAIRAAQLGLSTACIEGNPYGDPKGEPRLGGTCLNVGCIPSKALLHSSHLFEDANHHFETNGISVKGVSVDPAKMVARKNAIVDKMTGGIQYLFKKNKVTLLKGYGAFVGQADGQTQVKVTAKDGSEQIVSARNVIIATGSKARHLPNIAVDNQIICDNEGALNFTDVPKKLGVIGAGVIGLELGSVWRRLGAEVTVLEAMPAFLGAADGSIAKEAKKLFEKQGLKFELGVSINDVKTAKKGISISYKDSAGADKTLDCDKLIVSVGRVPNTDNLNLEAVGVKTNERGFIEVNHDCQTAVNGIWAIGDVIPGPMLAHKAEEEGVAVAERIVGQKPHIDYNCIPWVIYTSPEIAWVGRTEEQLKVAGRAYKSGQFPFMANGRALGMDAPEGFVKMIADAATDEILGVHIIGTGASDLIAEAVVAMEFKAAAEDIARVCHPHPSLSEVMKEAALAVDKRTLNM